MLGLTKQSELDSQYAAMIAHGHGDKGLAMGLARFAEARMKAQAEKEIDALRKRLDKTAILFSAMGVIVVSLSVGVILGPPMGGLVFGASCLIAAFFVLGRRNA